MKRMLTSYIALTLLLAATAPLMAQHRPDAEEKGLQAPVVLPGEFLVKVDPSDLAPPEYARTILSPLTRVYGITSIEGWLNPALTGPDGGAPFHKQSAAGIASMRGLGRILRVTYSSGISPEQVAAKVATLPGITYAEPVYRRSLMYVPNDPMLGEQWHLRQIRAFEAWDIARADASLVVAITDTGVEPLHPDLKNILWKNEQEMGTDGQGKDRRTNGADDDGNGLVDDWWGYDFGGKDGYSPDNNPTPAYWHGTHVAGIAGAEGNNGIGVAGVAHGVRLMAVKISDDRSTGDPQITRGFDGILYAAKMGARVINCSWGGPGFSQAERDVVSQVTDYFGAIIVAAAGNNGSNIASYPASYPGVLSVASLVQNDQRSTFSNYNTQVGLAAPGQDIWSTGMLGNGSSGYRYSSGTSMAAPIVAGAAALVLSRYPDLLNEQVIAVLRSTSDNIDALNPAFQYLLGSGRINLERALDVGPNALAASILDHKAVEEIPDGVIEPGEWIELRVRVKNILRPVNDLHLTLAPYGAAPITIETPEDIMGTLATGEIRESGTGIFRVKVPSNVPLDHILPLQLTLAEGTEEIAIKRIDLLVNPNYATTAHNRSAVTFTGNGRLGFNDFPSNAQGHGFRVDSSKNLLAEGGIMIGISADHLADVVRSGDIYHQSQGLKTVEPYRIHISDEEGGEVGMARFDDAHLSDLQRIGIDVRMKTLQYDSQEMGNQTLVFYTIRNTTSAPITNLFCALYLDWDIEQAGVYDQASVDLEHRLGYTQSTRNSSLPFAGAMLLSDQPMNFNALDNWTHPVASGFYQAEKWEAISSGIKREKSNIGDCSIIIGAGPIDIPPGGDTVVAFSLMGGVNLTELKSAAQEARRRFIELGGTPGGPISLPRELYISAGNPNPFRDFVDLEFAMPQEGDATIDIFNTRGEWVETLASGFFPRGTHTVRFKSSGVANAVYFVRMVALNQVLSRKLVYLAQ